MKQRASRHHLDIDVFGFGLPSPLEGEGPGKGGRVDIAEEENPFVRPVGGKRPLTARARRLRDKATAAENLLWRHLRRDALDGLHFRRQQPVGPYVADFFCASGRLIVELDGYFHETPSGVEHDVRRTAWLEAQGYRVIRFRNAAVWVDLERVLAEIRKAARPPSLTLPLEGGGDENDWSPPLGARA